MATRHSEIKIVVLGDSNSGKSSFLFRWKTDTFRGTSQSHSFEHKAEVRVEGKSTVTTSVVCIGKPLVCCCQIVIYS